MPETLNSGDVGTAFAKWWTGSTMSVATIKDKTTKGRDLLSAHYTSTTKDATTLLSMFLRRIAPVLLCVLLAGTTLTADNANRTPTLSEQTSNATRIYIGTVASLSAIDYTTSDGDILIATEVTLTITSTVKGPTAASIVITVEGGTKDGVTMRASKERVPAVSEKLRVFLTLSGSRWVPLNGLHGMVRGL
jgi:hypothetical protein